MRKVAIIGGGVVLAVILLLLTLPLLINVNRYRPQIQAELEKNLNRSVALGQLGLRLLPLSVRIADVQIGESPAFPSNRPFATAKQVFVSVGLFSLLGGHPSVKSIQLEEPQIELIRAANGTWNFSTLGPAAQSGSTTQSKGESKGTGSELALKELRIRDGSIGVTDLAEKKPRAEYNHLDLRLSDYAPKKRFSVSLDAHLPGTGQQLLSLDAKIGPIPSENMIATPVDGSLSLKEVSLSGAARFLSGVIPEKTDTVASGDAELRGQNGMLACKGKLTLEKTVVRGTSIGDTIELDYKLGGDLARKFFKIDSADVRIGKTPFHISGEVNSGRTPANVNVHFKTQNASMTELARLAGAAGVAFNPNFRVAGTLTADVTAQGPATRPALSGSLSAKNVEVQGGELKQPVRAQDVQVALAPDAIRANPFTVESGNTRLTAAFSLAQYTSAAPQIDATIRANGANLGELLAIAKAYGLEAAEGVNGSGAVTIDVRAQGSLAQGSNLNLGGAASLSNASISLPSLTKPVEVKTAALRFQQDTANLDNLNASLGSTNVRGSAAVRNFSAPNVSFNLAADKVNLTEIEQLSAKQPTTQPEPKGGKKPAAAQPAPGKPAGSSAEGLEKIKGSGTLAAGTLTANNLVLTNVKTTVNLDNGVIRLAPLTANLYGGMQTGAVTLDMRPADPVCSVNLKLAGVDVNGLLSAASSVKDRLYGALASSGDASFVLSPGGDITRTLNGTLSFNIANGRVRGVNLLNELSKIGRFSGGGGSDPFTNLKKVAGTLHIRNGVATTDDLTAAIEPGSLSAAGTVNLVDQGLNLRVTAVLGRGFSQSVGGTQIGGFLNTALANSQGELVLPVLVTGTMSNPSVLPDAQAMAQMKLKNLLPTSGNPGQLTTGILGSVLGNKGGKPTGLGDLLKGSAGRQEQQKPGASKSSENPEQSNPLDSILRGLKKKKDNKQ